MYTPQTCVFIIGSHGVYTGTCFFPIGFTGFAGLLIIAFDCLGWLSFAAGLLIIAFDCFGWLLLLHQYQASLAFKQAHAVAFCTQVDKLLFDTNLAKICWLEKFMLKYADMLVRQYHNGMLQ